MLHNIPLGILAALRAYNIADAYLLDNSTGYWSKTLTTSATHSGSVWVSRVKLGEVEPVLDGSIYFNASNQLVVNGLTSTAVYRDPTAFLHIFWNTSGAWVNGVAVTGTGTYATASIVNPRWGYDGTNFASMYFADHAFWDGSSVALNGGMTDATTGNWVASNPESPTYTRTDWTVNGTITQVTSTPMNTYATLNPLDTGTTGTLTNGNLTVSGGNAKVTLQPQSGDWYYEKDGVGVSVSGVFNPTLTAGTYNFGQNNWAGTGPTGNEKAVSTNNLLDNSALNIDEHFKTVLYTGTRATQVINTGLPSTDFVWAKRRDGIQHGSISDSLRGVNGQLDTTAATAETTRTDCVTAFGTDTFTLGADATDNSYNYYLDKHVAWCASLPNDETNTSGTITATWKYNAALGMAVGTYTGNGTAGATLGLPTINGTAPKFITWKNRSAAGGWEAWHDAIGVSQYLQLNTTAAAAADGGVLMNNTVPTSSIITLGSGVNVNTNTNNHVIYAFWETDLCKIGSYTGNGSADGPFANLSGAPVWFMTKNSGGVSSWVIHDTARSTYNPAPHRLFAEDSSVEVSTTAVQNDHVANGLKVRHSNTTINPSGGTMIYLAFVQPQGSTENPAR